MNRPRAITLAAAAAIAVSVPLLGSPPSARALNPIKPICTVAGLINGIAQKACSIVSQVTGGAASTATTALTVAAVVTWAVGGAKFLLHATSHVLAETTAPQLTSTWFSSTYWRVAEIAAMLTMPFLFAAATQAVLRSDLSLLIRAALGYLPLALLAVAIAAPLTMLLLAASDQLSAIVSSAAGHQSVHFLDRAAGQMGSGGMFGSSSFAGFLVALLTASGAIVLWMELLVREAAVYVIVLMLPLAFAAFVWPARRIWAVRSVELLVALILSKFAIVAVLSLGGAAVAQSANRSITGLLAGAGLMALAAFAPWAMLRVVPLTEIASGAAASLRGGAQTAFQGLQRADAWTSEGDHWASKTAQMRRTAQDTNGAADLQSVATGVSGTNAASAAKEGVEGNAGPDRSEVIAGDDANPGDGSGPGSGRPATASDGRDSGSHRANGGGPDHADSSIHVAMAGPSSQHGTDKPFCPTQQPSLDLDRASMGDLKNSPALDHQDLAGQDSAHRDPAAEADRPSADSDTDDMPDPIPPPQPDGDT